MPGTRAEYFRLYIKTRKQQRRAQLIEMLGGCCVRCGSAEQLEFDHIDPSTKNFNVCSDLTRAWADLVAEARLTQLLCRPCHIIKSAEDRPEVAHGLYRYLYWPAGAMCAERRTRQQAPVSGRGSVA